MNIVFLKGFEKEISKINDKKLALSIKLIIASVGSATELASIPNLKKLKGHKNAFRIRIGNHRIGIYFLNGVVTFAAFDHRKDIYAKFP
ncbi:MAG: plasmid stabilization protein [Bacteroidia bacterium]|nr:plasmid stabilization protein [Bacteroidia bacterium]